MRFNKNSIKELREREDMSLREFARVLGTSPTSVNNWETGYVKPGLAYIALMCSRFNVEPGYFFSQE